MTRFTPHTVRHPARRPLSPMPPATYRRQGERRTRPGLSPIWLAAILLGLWALVAMLLGALPWVLL